MTTATAIAAAERLALGILSSPIQYRRLTSRPGVEPRTYGTTTSTTALVSNLTTVQEYDQHLQSYINAQRITVRFPGSVAELVQGDQVLLPDGSSWAILELLSTGQDTNRYMCGKDVATLASGGDRGGGM